MAKFTVPLHDMIFKIIDNAELMKMLKEDTVFSEYIESESYKKIISSSNEKISSGEGWRPKAISKL